ncbi:MAG: acetyltransferase [Rubricoccaceae bacterium]
MSVLVIGGGGHARVVIATLHACGLDVSGILDDRPDAAGAHVLGRPVLGPVEPARVAGRRAVLAIGSNTVRRALAARLAPAEWVTAVHPHALVHPSASLGTGAVVFAGAVVQPEASVGAHAIVNTGASLDHDTRLGDFAHVAPGVRLAGGVTVGEGALLGIGACAIPGVTIGAWSTVGAGAAVVRDIPPGATAVGVPARLVAAPAPGSGSGTPARRPSS